MGQLFFSLVCLACFMGHAFSAASITQYGITWTFDRDYQTGQFANGDWWVLGPVTLTSITPDFTGTSNGWQVNPAVGQPQGLEQTVGNFSAAAVPSLPYTAAAGQSIVKAISLPNPGYPACIQVAAVLTVVAAVPPDNGATVFRPPLVGTSKPSYAVADLQTGLLPRFAPAPYSQTLDWVVEHFKRPRLEYQTGAAGRIIRPVDNYGLSDPYGSHVGNQLAEGALTLMLDYTVPDKMPALIAYIQACIDRYHCHLAGQGWGSGGGYQPNTRLPLVFLSVLFDDAQMKNEASRTNHFDDNMLYAGRTGQPLFGSDAWGDAQSYWTYIAGCPQSNTRQYADPYGYIDGGCPPDAYQKCCLSQPWKGTALAVLMMPALEPVFGDTIFMQYVDRWVNQGLWTQPDPCAPAKGTYGVDYGPDPGNPGDCIRDTDPSDGIGRFPSLHGTDADNGLYHTGMIKWLWTKYRASLPTGLSHPAGPVLAARPQVGLKVLSQPFKAGSGSVFFKRDPVTEGDGTAAVVDQQGRRVRNLSWGRSGTTSWDGRDHQGGLVKAGIYYLVHFKAGLALAAAKIIVIE